MDEAYWNNRYENEQTGWDIGYPSPPITNYLSAVSNKELKILIPGCGNAYEGAFCHEIGLKNTYLLDISSKAIENIKKRFTEIPGDKLIHCDFFHHENQYDLIIEQTFFCALSPNMREAYVNHMYEILKPKGKLVGLLFNKRFERKGPPFGGFIEEYKKIFSSHFFIEQIIPASNSIPPRMGYELFIELLKKN